MPVRARPYNPRLSFQYAVEIDGFGNWLYFSEAKVPTTEFEEVVIPQPGAMDTKVHGKRKTGDAEFSKGVLYDSQDTALWDWMAQQWDPATGETTPPLEVWRDVRVMPLNGTGEPIETYVLEGCWVKTGVPPDFKAGASEQQIEKFTLAVQSVRRE